MASRAIANRAEETSSPTEDLAMFTDKRLVILGGFGTSGGLQGNQQWKSMWDAFRNYGTGGGGAGGGGAFPPASSRSSACS